MILELEKDALKDKKGLIKYHHEFAEVNSAVTHTREFPFHF
jgi:hypothetical protein